MLANAQAIHLFRSAHAGRIQENGLRLPLVLAQVGLQRVRANQQTALLRLVIDLPETRRAVPNHR